MTEFEVILHDCLEALQEGRADVAACLAKYPAHAAELGPQLETAALLLQAHRKEEPREAWADAARERFLIASGARISEAFDDEPSPSFFAAARVKFLMAAHRMKGAGTAPPAHRPFFGGAFRLAAAFGIVLVGFMAFSTYTVASAQAALPGDWRYNVKLQTERVRLALAFSDSAERSVRIDIASERANEIGKLTAQGRIVPPGVIDNLNDEAQPLLAAVKGKEITNSGELARIRSLSERAEGVLKDPEVRVSPESAGQLAAATDTANALTLAVGVAQVNAEERPPVLTPTDPLETPEPTSSPEPTQTPDAEESATPEAPVEPPLVEPTPTPERSGLLVEETPVATEAGITWVRLAVGDFTTLIPSENDGWYIAGISVADGPVTAPALVRLSNVDGTQLITLNPRNGNMWWFVWVNGRFDEVQVRQIRDGQTYVIDRELVQRLYGPLADLPLYVLDHIAIAPAPAPQPTAQPAPAE